MQVDGQEHLHESIVSQALETGHYARILKHWYEVFDPDDLVLLPFSGLKEPRHLLQQLCTRVGLDASFYDSYTFRHENSTHTIRHAALHFGLRNKVNQLRRSSLARIPGLASSGKAIYSRALLPAYRRLTSGPSGTSDDEAVVAELRERYAGEADELFELTGLRGLID